MSGFLNLHDDSYYSSDGYGKDRLKELVQESWKDYPGVKYRVKIMSVDVDVDNASQAYIGNGAQVTAEDMTIKAKDKADIDALAAGVSAAMIGAAGASVAIVNKTNDVQAFAGDGTTIRGNNYESGAEDEVDVNAEAIAGAAGALGVEGTYAGSSIVSKLKSYVGDAVLSLAENFRMFTSGVSHGNAEALGVNAGLLTVGASVAQSDIDIDNQAVVESGAEILGLGHGRRLLLLWEIPLFSGIISHLPRKHNGKSQKHRKISPVHSQSQHRTCSNSNQSRVRSSTISQAPSSRNR